MQAIRARLDLTQEQLAERLGVSFATVNRWEGGVTTPQRAARTAIAALAAEAGVDGDAPEVNEAESAASVTRRRSRRRQTSVPDTKPMEQMLWDAACSIRGEKDAAKFKDYLLPLLFLKRLSDVFDDEIDRLTQEFGDRAIAQEIAESDHELLRFYLPPEARWGVVSGREPHEWPPDTQGRTARPRDVGEHLTKAVRAVVRWNPTLSGVIDLVDFASERNGERDLIDGVVLLPDNLFYNTSAAGIIVVLSKRKPEARRGKIVLVNAGRRVGKGRPKNYIPKEDIRSIAAAFLKGEPVEGEVAVITREQAQETDYNLSPSRWVGQTDAVAQRPIAEIIAEMQRLDEEALGIDDTLARMLVQLR